MALVEPVDGRGRRRQKLVVAGDMLGRGVEPVRQQGEPKVSLAIRQVVDFQAADLGLDIRLAGEEDRHDDERPEPGRHTSVQVQPGQSSRTQHVGHSPVHEGDRQVGGRGKSEDRDDQDAGAGGASVPGEQERHGEDERRDQSQRSEVTATRAGSDVGTS